jgi:hypothetical protein
MHFTALAQLKFKKTGSCPARLPVGSACVAYLAIQRSVLSPHLKWLAITSSSPGGGFISGSAADPSSTTGHAAHIPYGDMSCCRAPLAVMYIK